MINTLEIILAKFNLDPHADYSKGHLPLNLTYFTREKLAELFAELGFENGAEVGVERGLYSEVLCKANPKLYLQCVDPWQTYRDYREHVTQSKLDEIEADARARLKPYNVEFIKQFSMDAVKAFELDCLDFVYIDGNHQLEWVAPDIREWAKRVRPGGIVAGHDYFEPKNNAVMKYAVKTAVRQYTEEHHIAPWFITRGDRPSTWFWVK